MQVTSGASFSRTEVTLCARSAGVEVVVDKFRVLQLSAAHCTFLCFIWLIYRGALQVTPRPLHVRDCLGHCTATPIYFFNSLSELCATFALLYNGSRVGRTRQDEIKETRTWYNHAKYSFLIGRQCIPRLSLNTSVCPI